MRITFLVFNLDGMGGTSRAAITQANSLADRHQVRLLSVTRSADSPHYPIHPRVRVDHLVDVRDEPRLIDLGGVPPSQERDLQGRPSLLVPQWWDAQFSALTDVALESCLPGLESDILITVTPGLLAAAVQLCRSDVAVVHQEHRSSSDRVGGLEPLLAFGPRADAVALLTDANAAWLRERLGDIAPPILVMPNALSPGFTPQSRLDNPLIVSAGRLVHEKQFGQLIQAFARIADRLPEWRLRIFGDGPYRNLLLATARKHGLYDRFELPGTVTDLAGEWAKASICALSSQAEGYPLVLQEAMAAGVPVISYDCPSGPRAIVQHGVTGLLVAPGSVAGLAQALLRLAEDPELRTQFGAASLRSIHRWDPERIAGRWESAFREVLQRRAATGRSRGRLAIRQLMPPPDGAAPTEPERPAAEPLPGQLATDAVRLSTTAARRAADGDWFVIPGHDTGTPVVVVPADRRGALLRALTALPAPGHLCLRDPADHGWAERRGTVVELAGELTRAATSRVFIESWSGGTGVAIEFWVRSADGDLIAPRPNRYTDRVAVGAATTTTMVAGIEVPTLPVMTAPVVGEITFPVDVVYTWVDGADPVWQSAKDRRLAGLTGTALDRTASGSARFDARDELRYSLRSVHAFAPWVRRIFLVTAGQRPDWLITDDRLTVVDHSEILPADALPTFNSHAIETGLHHIDDLAEHFIYINDDVFLGRPVRPELFFSAAGSFATFPSQHPVGLPEYADAPYLHAALNNRTLLEDAFGVTLTATMAHTPHPHRRSVLSEIEGRFPDAVAATARSPFRSEADISLLSNLAQHYGLITGSAYVGRIEHTFVNLSTSALKRLFRELLQRQQDSICLGDHHDYAFERSKVDWLLSEFLEEYLPTASPWERGTSGTAEAT